MNPLLFADWGRMNRLFTKIMWAVAAIMVCVVLAVLVSAGRPPHTAPTVHPAAASGGAAGVAAGAHAVSRRAQPR